MKVVTLAGTFQHVKVLGHNFDFLRYNFFRHRVLVYQHINFFLRFYFFIYISISDKIMIKVKSQKKAKHLKIFNKYLQTRFIF